MGKPLFFPSADELLGDSLLTGSSDDVLTWATVDLEEHRRAHRLTVDQMAYLTGLYQTTDEGVLADVPDRIIPALVDAPEYRAATSTVRGWLAERCDFDSVGVVTPSETPDEPMGFCDAVAVLADSQATLPKPRELDLRDEATVTAVRSLDDAAAPSERGATRAYRFAAFAWAGLNADPSTAGEETFREALASEPYVDAHDRIDVATCA